MHNTPQAVHYRALGLYDLRNSLLMSGQTDEAVKCLRRAIDFQPDCGDAHDSVAGALYQQGDFETATQHFRRAVLSQGKADEAAAAYRRALQLKPDYVDAHHYLNNALAIAEPSNVDEVGACYRQALKLKPDLLDAHHNLGNALTRQGKLDEAVASYQCALERKPDYADAHNNLGNALDGLAEQWRSTQDDGGFNIGITWQGSPLHTGDRIGVGRLNRGRRPANRANVVVGSQYTETSGVQLPSPGIAEATRIMFAERPASYRPCRNSR